MAVIPLFTDPPRPGTRSAAARSAARSAARVAGAHPAAAGDPPGGPAERPAGMGGAHSGAHPVGRSAPSARHPTERSAGVPSGQATARAAGGPVGRSAGRSAARSRRAVVSAPPPATAVALVEQARRGLAGAVAAEDAAERYAGAHLAALRAAAAVVAVRARPDRRRQRPVSVWALLASVAPELSEWATFFAAGSKTRAAVQAGVTRLVSTRDADDLVRQVEEFIGLADRTVRGGDL